MSCCRTVVIIALLCCAVLCKLRRTVHAIWCCAMLCYAEPCCAVVYCAVLFYGPLLCGMLCCAVLCRSLLLCHAEPVPCYLYVTLRTLVVLCRAISCRQVWTWAALVLWLQRWVCKAWPCQVSLFLLLSSPPTHTATMTCYWNTVQQCLLRSEVIAVSGAGMWQMSTRSWEQVYRVVQMQAFQ